MTSGVVISTETDGIKACPLAGDNVALTVADVQRVRTVQIGRSSLEICRFRLLFSKALAGRLSGTDRLDVPVKAVLSKNELDDPGLVVAHDPSRDLDTLETRYVLVRHFSPG